MIGKPKKDAKAPKAVKSRPAKMSKAKKPASAARLAQNQKTAAALASLGIKTEDFSVPSIDKVRGMYDRPGKPYGENVEQLLAEGYEFRRVTDSDVKAYVGKGWVLIPDGKVQMRGSENIGQMMIRDPATAAIYAERRAQKDAQRRGDRTMVSPMATGGQINQTQRSLSTRSLI